MLGDWLKDVAEEQLLHGGGYVPPFVAPNVVSETLWPHFPQAIWDDVVILTPWDLRCSYGDADVLPSHNSRTSEKRREPTCRPRPTCQIPGCHGFAGTPIITNALTKAGHHQISYQILLEKNRPSWMYPISMVATTVWERWDSMLPDGSINPGDMTSFNYYALGSIVNWLHSKVAGVRSISPGWKDICLEPIPWGTIDFAQVAYETPHGRFECGWKVCEKEERFEMKLLVPVNSKALVILPHNRSGQNEPERKRNNGARVGSELHRFECHLKASEYRLTWSPKPIIPIMRKPESDSIA